MRYLKKPKTKRSDPTTEWSQKYFNNTYKDIPASEVPNSSVTNAENALLFGNRVFIRPGDEVHKQIGFPFDKTQSFTSGISKSGSTVTHSGAGFTSSDVGKTIYWETTGDYEEIIGYTNSSTVTVDSSTAQTDTSIKIRSQVWGNIWHEASKLIIIHIENSFYYNTWDFAQAWQEITLPSGQSLAQLRTKFDKEDDFVYAFNANGIFCIDITDPSNPEVYQINQTAPSNSINVSNDNKASSLAFSSDFPAKSEEDDLNIYGRRYLFSLTRLEGLWNANRGDGTRIQKESSTNSFSESTDFIDYKESWSVESFDTADVLANTRLSTGVEIFAFSSSLNTLQNSVNMAMAVTVTSQNISGGSATRDLVADITKAAQPDWVAVAETYQAALRAAFPEMEYLRVAYRKSTNQLVFLPGEVNASIDALDDPVDTSYNSIVQIIGNLPSDFGNPAYGISHKPLGTKDDPALELPSGQKGYTHFSVYSTKTFGRDFIVNGNDTVNRELYVWQKDVPIIKPFPAIIDSNGYIYTEALEDMDLNSWIKYNTSDEIKFTRLPQTQYLISEANGHNNNAAITSNLKIEGTTDASPVANQLVDTGANFISNGISINDYVFNKDTLQGAYVTAVFSNYLVLSKDIFTSGSEDYATGGGPCAIGSSEPRFCTKSGNTVTLISGPDFTDGVGELLFWEDGTVDLITAVSTSTATVSKSGTKSLQVCAKNSIGRNYNDGFTDTLLDARASAFPANSRFLSALPNSDIGAITPGFMVVATENELRGYYSQYSSEFRYLAGHYASDTQFFILEDTIKELQKMPDHLVAWCKNSTYKFQTNVINTTDDGIAILSGQSVVDENIGISDRLGVISFGQGYKMVVTSEPGIRLFDSYRYTENRLIDQEGRGFYQKDFQVLKDRILAYYEPNLYGMMFWGTKGVNVLSDGTPLLGRTNKCYRMAVERQQGFGFSELLGNGWNFIESNCPPLLITDGSGNKITILFDTNEGYPHRLSTRKLPDEGGSSSEIDMNFSDNEPVGGGSGIEIPWKLKLREHIAEEENWKLRYLEEYWYLRPYNESNKNNSGYDQFGHRSAQVITVKCFTDGNSNEVSEAYTVNPKATIFQPYEVENRRIQIEISGTASELYIVGTRAFYDVLKRRAFPNVQMEHTQQEWIQSIIYRLSRGYPKTLNLATAVDNSQTAELEERVGPDSKSNSSFRLISGYVSHTAPENTYRQLIMSFKGDTFDATSKIYGEYKDVDNYRLELRWGDLSGINVDFNNSEVLNIPYTPGDWITIMVTVGMNNTITVYYTDSSLTVTTLTGTFSGDYGLDGTEEIRLGEGLSNLEEFFDIIIHNSEENEITEEAFTYYARDVYKYEGFSLLPAVESQDYTDYNLIEETGSASDTYQETGGASDTIQEIGGTDG
jgi:hypothetical protein